VSTSVDQGFDGFVRWSWRNCERRSTKTETIGSYLYFES